MECEICNREIKHMILIRGRIDKTGNIYGKDFFHEQCYVETMIKLAGFHKDIEVER